MIPVPFGWSVELLAHGIALAHPRGPAVASIVYRDRARPLRRIGALVDEFLATVPAFAADRPGTPERLLTREGEHAALITIVGTEAGKRVQRDLGYVFADDFYAVVSGICHEQPWFPQLTDLVRTLAQNDTQALGIRRRRFEYTPPRDWQPIARSLVTEWLAPAFPRDATRLVVYAANPLTLVSASVEQLTAELETYGYHVEVQQPIQELARGKLRGHHQIVRGTRAGLAPMVREIVVLQDATYAYAFELSSLARFTEAREALHALLETVRPVPSPQELTVGPALTHWTD